MNTNIPISILDLATITEADKDLGEVYARSLSLAQHAEQLGYRRYWFAEHHNMESVASAATSVLVGYVAGGTQNIRVGSGGIMLPNHAPLVIAEQFGTLEALYPGRIDLGIGRAPGTDPVTSHALRRSMKGDIDNFPNDVIELLTYLGKAEEGAKVKAIPGQGSYVPVWLLGSSTYSAQLAAMLGLPFAFASHFAPTYLEDALEIYKKNFKPSAVLQQPYAMACVNMILADTDEEAQSLATSFYQLALGLFRNTRKPLPPPVPSMEGIWSEQERMGVQHMMYYSFIGSPATVEPAIRTFIDSTGISELMITSHMFDVEKRKRSMQMAMDMLK
jgi:luciferase family oxidoreductase group 1